MSSNVAGCSVHSSAGKQLEVPLEHTLLFADSHMQQPGPEPGAVADNLQIQQLVTWSRLLEVAVVAA